MNSAEVTTRSDSTHPSERRICRDSLLLMLAISFRSSGQSAITSSTQVPPNNGARVEYLPAVRCCTLLPYRKSGLRKRGMSVKAFPLVNTGVPDHIGLFSYNVRVSEVVPALLIVITPIVLRVSYHEYLPPRVKPPTPGPGTLPPTTLTPVPCSWANTSSHFLRAAN